MLTRIKLFVLFSILASQMSGQQDPLRIDFTATSTASPGSPLEVEVRLSDFDQLFVTQYFVLWDSTVLEVDSIPFISTELPNFFRNSITLPAEDNQNPRKGKLRVSWGDASPASLPDDTHLFTIRFNTIGMPCDETNLVIGPIGEQQSQIIEILDQNFDEIGAITDGLPVEIPGTNCDIETVEFNFPSISADAGENICIPLRVMHFDSIDSFGGSVQWDASVLQYTGLQSFGVTDFSESDFGTTNVATGSLSYGWIDGTGANPETLVDGSTLVEICFDVIGAPGSSSVVTVTGSPNAVTVTKSGPTPSDPSVPLPFTLGSGAINVNNITMPNPLILNFPDVDAADGENVCVPITVSNFDNINGFTGTILWDPSILGFTNVQSFGFAGLTAGNFITTQAINGTITYGWSPPPGGMPVSLPDGANLVELCFDVSGNPGDQSDLLISGSPNPLTATTPGINAGDPDIQLEIDANGGSIGIPSIGGNDDVLFILPDLSGNNGDNVCIPVTVENFTNIISANGSVSWNPDILSFTGTQNFGLPGFNSSNLNASQTDAGFISFVWADINNTSATLADGSTIIELCFDVIGDESEVSPLNFVNMPTMFTVGRQVDPSLPSVDAPFMLENGSYTVLMGGTGTGDDDVIFTIPDVCIAPGDMSVCIPIEVENFDRIASVEFSMMWDPAVLEFDETDNVQLFGFNAGSQLNPTMAPEGKLTMSWFDGSTANPVTLDDGDVMMEFCFNVLGSLGDCSPVMLFSGEVQDGLTPIFVSQAGETPNDPVEKLGHQENNGEACIKTPPENVFHLNIGEVTINAANQLACVEFRVEGFEDIISAEWNMVWDANDLCFNSVNNINTLTSVDEGRFSLLSDDRLKLAWSDPSLSGNTIPDGDIFYEVCFDNKMACPSGSTEVTLLIDGGQAAVYEVTNEENPTTPIPSTFDEGGVVLACGMTAGPTIISSQSQDACFNDCNGSIMVAFNGGTAPITCEWSGDFTFTGNCDNGTSLINNLCAGTYTLEITDDENRSVSRTFVIEETAPVVINAVVTNATCTTGGSIQVNPSGGTGPYTISPDQSTLVDLEPGSYPVTVTDDNDCTAMQFIDVGTDCVSDLQTVIIIEKQADGCSGGKIRSEVTGGVGSTSVFYSPAITDLCNVPPDTYVATCRDSAGNEDTFRFTITTTQVDPLIINILSTTPATCDELGAVDYEILGGCPPYSCITGKIENGMDVPPGNVCDDRGLMPSEYYIIIEDDAGNETRATFIITQEAQDPIQIAAIELMDAGPCLGNSGSVFLEVTGGCGDYECQLNGVLVDCNTTIPLLAGDYMATAKEVGTIEEEMISFTIEEPDTIVFRDPIIDTVNCTIRLNLEGGTPEYEADWFDPDDNQVGDNTLLLELDSNAEDFYYVFVTDQNGCRYIDTIEAGFICRDTTITGIDTSIVISTLTSGETNCADRQNCTGVISGILQQVDFTGPYLITVVNQELEQTSITLDMPGPFEITNLCAGSYEMTVTDRNGLGTVTNIAVPLQVIATAELVVLQLDTMVCADASTANGSLAISFSGGVGPYTVTWIDNLGDTIANTAVVTDLEPGRYLAEVVDVNGCAASQFLELEQCDIPEESCDGRPVITPNGDGANEVLNIPCVNAFSDNNIGIYDRWGRLVFETDDYLNDWAGTGMDNQILPEGAYYWVLRYADGGVDKIAKGTVTLLKNQ